MRTSDWSSDVCSSDLHELEHRIKAFAFVDRAFDQRLGQVEREPRIGADEQTVAEEDRAAVRPQPEMAETELLVDQRQRLVRDRALVSRSEERSVGKESVRTLSSRW